MKIHEYQGKDIFKSYGIPIQDGYVIENIEDASATIEKVQQEFNTEAVVVKAQIHAGGRGKGGGVKYSPTTSQALENAQNMLGMQLVTHQTGTEGQKVRKLYITEAVWIDPLIGMKSFQARKLAFGLELTGDAFKTAVNVFMKMYACYVGTDASIVEINPLVLTEDDRIVALDAKFNFDGNAMYRHKNIADLRDVHEEDPTELEASKYDLNYIKLDGNVGCMVNGAGLAMATMDIIKLAGGEPANFLDVGGAASAETVKNGFKIILSDEHVKAILINIFGGIVRCDRVATGVIQAVKELGLKVPVVVRLEGTNAEGAKTILSESGLDIIPANDMKDAAQKVVDAAIKN